MANRFQFFNSTAGDRTYSADAWAQVLTRVVADGYLYGVGNGLQVLQASPAAMTLRVDTGVAFVQGRFFEVYSAPETGIVVTAADATNPRIDRLVVRLDFAGRQIVLAVRAGTPASSPVAPTLQRDATYWELSLARIAVAATATSIVTANITDERDDSTVCGKALLVPQTAHQALTNNPHATTAVQVGAVHNMTGVGAISVSAKDGSNDQVVSTSAAVGAQVNIIEDVSISTPNSQGVSLGTLVAKVRQIVFTLATTSADGLMAAADKALLATATALATAFALMRRDSGGGVAASTFTGALAGNASTASALQGGGADRIKLDSLPTGATLSSGVFTGGQMVGGGRWWTSTAGTGTPPATLSWAMTTFTLPAGLTVGTSILGIRAEIIGGASDSVHLITVGIRSPSSTQIQVVAGSTDGVSTLATLMPSGGGVLVVSLITV